MEKDAMFTFRLPAAVRKALEEAAKSERRSVGSLTVLILEEWLAANAGKAGAKTKRKTERG
jgi:hypothetical protein